MSTGSVAAHRSGEMAVPVCKQADVRPNSYRRGGGPRAQARGGAGGRPALSSLGRCGPNRVISPRWPFALLVCCSTSRQQSLEAPAHSMSVPVHSLRTHGRTCWRCCHRHVHTYRNWSVIGLRMGSCGRLSLKKRRRSVTIQEASTALYLNAECLRQNNFLAHFETVSMALVIAAGCFFHVKSTRARDMERGLFNYIIVPLEVVTFLFSFDSMIRTCVT